MSEITLDELWDMIVAAKPVFWVCPKGCRGGIEWHEPEMTPKCLKCGAQGQPHRPREQADETRHPTQ